jgi:hypothetical protein
MRNTTVMALLLAPLVGCFAQIEDPSVVMTHPLCPTGTDCVPGGGTSLSYFQVSGTNTFVVNFGDQPLLKSSTSVGPATVNTKLILNRAMFDMKTTNADFTGVTSVKLVVAPRQSTGPSDDPCAAPTNCPVLAQYTQSPGNVANQQIVLSGNSSDLITYIDQASHQMIIEIQATGTAPTPPLWSADVSMDMAFESRANFP